MSKTKVAFFADCLIRDFDGAVRTMYQLIDRIPNDDFEYLFITGDAPTRDFPHECLVIPSLKLPVNSSYKMTLSFLAEGKIFRKLSAFKPDVIHLSTPSPLGMSGLKYANQNAVPVHTIYHTHFISYVDYYLEQMPLLIPPVKRWLIGRMQSFYNQCDQIYVPTELMLNSLKQVGVFDSNMKIWKRGIAKDIFKNATEEDTYLQDLTGNKNPNILFCSRLVNEKNLKTLNKIYKVCREKNKHFNFVIAGDGYARKDLEQVMPEAYFLGHVDHHMLAKVYRSSDIFLFPSVTETYGNVVAEAMASGLPCVIANGGGSAEFIRSGVNGYLCAPYDPQDYVEKIESLLDDEQLYQQFKEAGIVHTSKLSWDSLADTYFEDIKTLVKPQLAQSA